MNLTKFIDEIKSIGVTPNSQNYFRGHSDKIYKLTPSIYRHNLVDNEDNIFKEAILRTPHEFVNCKSTIEKLTKMQHYGVPTRLLDITSNPLIALYFACSQNGNKDGEVFFLQIPDSHIKFYDSDTVSVLANIAKRPKNFEFDSLAKSISAFNKTFQIEYLLHEIKEEKSYFQNLINPKHLEEVYAVKVKLDNQRILKQEGAFLLFGVNARKISQAEVSNKWVASKIVIPSNDKIQILKDLSSIGINHSTLFPEIENQGKHLIEKYKNSI